MKKLIALAMVAVMLVVMSLTVFGSVEVVAPGVLIDNTTISDGTISEGEYGDYVAYVTSDKAYTADSEDEIDGCNSYIAFQGSDPFFMDCYIYIAWAYDETEEGTGRFYFAWDVNNIDGKFSGMNPDEDWNDDAVQWRMSADVTEPQSAASSDLWGNETFNMIFTADTRSVENTYYAPGAVITNGDCLVVDHNSSNREMTTSGKWAGSIGVKEDRIVFEGILRSEFFCSNPKLEEGRKFTYSCNAIFMNSTTATAWNGYITWGHGSTGTSGLGQTGTNGVTLGGLYEPETEDPENPDQPAEGDGDALVVVIATAIMALGTAVVVKKVK